MAAGEYQEVTVRIRGRGGRWIKAIPFESAGGGFAMELTHAKVGSEWLTADQFERAFSIDARQRLEALALRVFFEGRI
jgi:hypothetical protein